MKTYKRSRTLEELKAAVEARGWILHTTKYEEGSDYVSFRFRVGRVAGIALVSMFNGQLMGELDDRTIFTDKETTHECKLWFKTLLETAYTNEPTTKATPA